MFFVDYGDFDYISKENILPLPQRFVKILPFQAVECALDGIVNEETWPLEAGDELWNFTHDDNNYFYTLLVRNLEQLNSEENQTRKYLVRLFRKNSPELIDVSHRLVAVNCAKLADIEEVFTFEETIDCKGHPLKSLVKQFVVNFVR